MTTADHVASNREAWDAKADEYAGGGAAGWDSDEIRWGIFQLPDAQVGMFPEVASKRVIDLGCGTGYVSNWIARRAASLTVGIDNSPAQLATAKGLQRQHGVVFPLIWGDAEQLPFTAECFDIAISEYGACLWCDPDRWIPEAARVLRPGGRLIFLTNSVQLMLSANDDEAVPAAPVLVRPLFGMGRTEWPDAEGAIEFHLSHGDMVRNLRRNGFVVDDLIEIQVPTDADTRFTFVTADWASRWPAEEVWIATYAG